MEQYRVLKDQADRHSVLEDPDIVLPDPNEWERRSEYPNVGRSENRNAFRNDHRSDSQNQNQAQTQSNNENSNLHQRHHRSLSVSSTVVIGAATIAGVGLGLTGVIAGAFMLGIAAESILVPTLLLKVAGGLAGGGAGMAKGVQYATRESKRSRRYFKDTGHSRQL